ncbi:MAG: hypothetical protein VCC99_16685 [Alphaproteobacteria bacterium]|jgi:hypothetical protein
MTSARLSLFAAAVAALVLLVIGAPGAEAKMKVRFADEAWTGDTIPEGQWCSKFDGAGATPALLIDGVPDMANGIVVAFNDESYAPMDKGGHGILLFMITPERPIRIPSIAGETTELPDDVIMVKAHKAKSAAYSPGTAYLPPCSGGIGNKYTATVQMVQVATDGRYTVLQTTKITLGRY